MEKEIKSVANVTQADIEAFLPIAAAIPLRVEVQHYPLEEANEALRRSAGRPRARCEGPEDCCRTVNPFGLAVHLTSSTCTSQGETLACEN